MEFLRFGSSIPGSSWGCCAVNIIQNFSVDPDTPASIQIVNGDSGTPMTRGGKSLYAGPTYRDIFWQRLRCGTFSSKDLPNQGFLAIITQAQLSQANGRKWLVILKEAGFEFVRAVSNSVYTGSTVGGGLAKTNYRANYIFGLFRNIGNEGLEDQFTPPSEWLELDALVAEPWSIIKEATDTKRLTKTLRDIHTDIWETRPVSDFLSEEELIEKGVPVFYAGLRSEFPQELAEYRKEKIKTLKKASGDTMSPWGGNEEEEEYDEEFDEEFDD